MRKIEKQHIEDILALTPMQEGILSHYLKDPTSNYYFEQLSLEISGEINVETFENAWDIVIQCNEMLRTVFRWEELEKPTQIILKKHKCKLAIYDLSDIAPGSKNKALEMIKFKDRRETFDLNQVPFRVILCKIDERKYEMIISNHHILYDGWSNGIILKEFFKAYHEFYKGKYPITPPIKSFFREFIKWVQNQDKNKQKQFWIEYLCGVETPTSLPIKRRKSEAKEVESYSIFLDKDIKDKLEVFAKNHRVTLASIFYTTWGILLQKYCSSDDVIFGTTVAGRSAKIKGIENIVGLFINTIPLRVRTYPDEKISHVVFLINRIMKDSEEFENTPLTDIKSYSQVENSGSLFDTIVSFENYPLDSHLLPGDSLLSVNSYSIVEMTNYDLSVGIIAFDDIKINFCYHRELFDNETISNLARHFKGILQNVVENPEGEIYQLEIISAEEKNRLLYDFNNTGVRCPGDKTIHELFEDQVNRTPDYIAILGPSISVKVLHESLLYLLSLHITYKELNEKSSLFALLLRQKSVEVGTIVGIMVERSIEMILGIMGILKAGGAYLPIDQGYPRERIDSIKKDSAVKIVVTSAEMKESVFPRAFPPTSSQVSPANLAYVIYTSGSTGIPKGVMVKHSNVVSRVKNSNFIGFTKGDRLLLTGAIVFDITTFEIWGPLLNGSRLVLTDQNVIMDAEKLGNFLLEQQITILHFIPQLFNQMIIQRPGIFKKLEYFLIGGDWVNPFYINILRNECRELKILHMYGPTENTTFSTSFLIEMDYEGKIPIGQPLSNSSVYILDRYDQLQPIGIEGEICTGGEGVTMGYLNRVDWSQDKFIKNPFIKNERIYKTGDRGRWMPDGNMEFLGRNDSQLKIRGYRIEPGEIESQLLSHEKIKEAVVLGKVDASGDKYLCCYIVLISNGKSPGGDPGEIEESELREFLSRRLPAYMIPSFFVKLDKIPLTPTGKINRKALTETEEIYFNDKVKYVPPTSDIEKKLVETWEKVLDRNNIGIKESFFSVGGDSIKAIQIISRMSRAGYKLEMKDIFQYPIISDLAPRVKKIKNIPDQSAITGTIPLTPIQKAFFQQSHIDPHHFNQGLMLYSKERLEKETLVKVFFKIQEHHDALRINYRRDVGSAEVIQVINGLDYPLALEEYDLQKGDSGFQELQTGINRVQASIDLEKGPLLKLGLFHLKDEDRLLIVIHHLVVDGVSWRILLEDIQSLYTQYKTGKQPFLPPKTDSFKLWAERLSVYANTNTLLQEKNFWSELESQTVQFIRKDFETESNYIGNARGLIFTLAKNETGNLLTKANDAFKTGINDILLTALAIALKKTFGYTRVLIAMEGHGREEIPEDINVTRTVGWFTSVYPVLIDISYANNLGRQIKETKETLRRIPNKGAGYGILKYLTREENKKDIRFKLKPQISFNYLGQFDTDVKQIASFEIAGEPTGNMQSNNNQREYEIEVSGIITDNRLTMNCLYNEKHFRQETIAPLIRNLESELRHLIAFCCSRERTEPTPADFTYKGLSIESVERITSLYPYLEDLYTLTPMQEGMLFHTLFDGTSYSYFEQMSYRMQENLDIDLVEKSLNELFKRHAVLRTAFLYKDIERPVQVVFKERLIDFYFEDISKVGKMGDKENDIKAFKARDKERRFDLGKDSLMRVSVFRLDNSLYELIWSIHHILIDGWCLGIINTEFFEIYESLLEKKPYRLLAVTPYRHYIQWLEKQDKRASLKYWQNYLELFETQTPVPTTRILNSNEKKGYRNETVSVVLNGEKTAMLNKLSARYQVTSNTLTRTFWGILLGKYNGKDDVVFGAVVSGRPSELEGVESMIGLFINTIPVRIRFEEEMKFFELLQKAQEEAITGEPHHYQPLAEIQARSPLKQNLIDHIFVYENYPIAEQIEGYGKERNAGNRLVMQLTDVEVHEQTHYDFNVILGGTEEIKITFQYNSNVYDREFVERIAKHYLLAFDCVMGNEEIEIRDIAILSGEEKSRILYEFNATGAGYPADKSIHRLFEELAKQIPDRIALIGPQLQKAAESTDGGHNTMSFTYQELNRTSNRLAYRLKSKGIGIDTTVGIIAGRSPEMLVGILGILKSGGAYLPIDPEYPAERINYMLTDSASKILVTTQDCSNKIKFEKEIVNIPDAIIRVPKPPHPHLPPAPVTSLAYIIYTSGTTGRPKGTLIQHRNVVSLLFNDKFLFDFGSNDTWSLFHSYCFDFSVWEMYGALLYGGKLVIVPKMVSKDPHRYLEILEKDRVTVLNQTPAAFYNLAYEVLNDANRARKLELRYVIFGGEALKPIKLKQWKEKYPAVKLINMFGITETTVHVTYKEVGDKEIENNIGNIGKPIPTLTVYVLDKGLNPVPVGVAGELCVGGDGVGRGYLNLTELTKEKFVDNPYKQGDRLYKSGDLGRFLENGDMEYLGRIDHQVKIRGFRIELGEIERQLLTHNAVKEAVVLAWEDQAGGSTKYLCAYVVPVDQEVFKEGFSLPVELRDHLSRILPDYMVPSYFVKMERIPLNANGKLDRKALPEPGIQTVERCAKPRNELEELLVKKWAEVLAIPVIGIHDNFFEIGGDSIKAIQIAARLNKSGYKIEIKDIFTNPLISGLALKVKKIERIGEQSAIEGTIPLTPIQKRFFEYHLIKPHHFNQAVMLHAREGLEEGAVKAIFTKIQEHHDALRMVYRNESGEIFQANRGLAHPLSIETDDLRKCEPAVETLMSRCQRIQAGIHLETGPLMKLGLFHLEDGHRLLIAVHHLVIDAVSWRILFEDIETLYRQYKKGEPLKLPLKTDSYKLWAEKLEEYAQSKLFLKEKAYWRELELKEIPGLKREFEEEGNFITDGETLSIQLDEPGTEILLKRTNGAFGTEINDILLTSLGLALKKVFKQDRFLIAMEGHGRETILKDIDVNRTVGWFTSVYPVLLEISCEGNLSRQVKEIKESLRQVPNKGIGYGLLKYVSATGQKPEMNFNRKPQISFNYLGRFDAELEQMSSFEIAKESYGDVVSPDERREYEFEVSGMIVKNRLSISIGFNRKHYPAELVNALLNDYREALTQVITFCSTREKKELTPSDFTYTGLSIETVEMLQERYANLVEDIYPLTPMQEGMLFHALVDDSSYSYFEQMSYRLQGELDISLVEKSFNELFKRHDILRTAFVYKDIDRPLQVVLKNRVIDFYYEDISKIGEREPKENFVRECRAKDKQRLFDLSKDALMRVSISRLDKSEYEFTWSFHHILMDGWCMGILNSEFFEIYESNIENRAYRLPAVKPYRNYIQWLEKQDHEVSARYWQVYLGLFEEQTGVPGTGITVTTGKGYRHDTFSVVLNKEKTAMLDKLSARFQVTSNTVMQTLWGILLGKYNTTDDVVFGAVVSGRPFELEGVEAMVGLFINTIPVRIRFAEEMKFSQLLTKVQEEAIAGESYQYHPLAEIQNLSSLKQNLIDHIFIFENYPIYQQIEGGGKGINTGKRLSLKLTDIEVFEQSNYDFNLVLGGIDELKITFQYNENAYNRDFVKAIAGQVLLLFDQVMGNEEIAIRDMTLLSPQEKNRVLYEFNATAAAYSGDKSIHRLFEEKAQEIPGQIAASFYFHQSTVYDASRRGKTGSIPLKGEHWNSRTGGFYPGADAKTQSRIEKKEKENGVPVILDISYKKLAEQANRLAQVLIEKGIGPGSVVGITAVHSIEIITGLLAVLKTGGAYLPLDLDYPPERIKYIIADSNIDIILTNKGTVNNLSPDDLKKFGESRLVLLDELPGNYSKEAVTNPVQINNPRDLAYIIYTSGTTGYPKGVMVNHNNVLRLVKNQNYIDFIAGDKLLMTGSLMFDISTFEIWGSLLNGIDLFMAHKDTILDTEKMTGLVREQGISILHLIPQLFNLMFSRRPELFAGLRYFMVGGDLVNPNNVNHLRENYPHLKILHMYGPTENTTFSTYYKVDREFETGIPIGKPIGNSSVYVVGRDNQFQPLGVVGELYVGGEGVARGYLNQPELTKENFINSLPGIHPPSPLYKTGDLARWLPDGGIEFLGRKDNQVKIRGQRIEIGEIEKQLSKHAAVKDVVVLARENQDAGNSKYLCAYVVLSAQDFFEDGPAMAADFRNYLSGILPNYMIPSYFVQMEHFPLNPNGKIDRKALPLPALHVGEKDGTPRNEVEEILVKVWSEVLGTREVGINDNFFELGGDSIKSIQIASRLNRSGYKVEMRDIFSNPILSGLALKVKKVERVEDRAVIEGIVPLTPIQKYFFEHYPVEPHHFNQAGMLYSREVLEEEAVKAVFAKIQEHHDALRMVYRKEPGKIIQLNRGLNHPCSIEVYDLRKCEKAIETLTARCDQIQAGIDLQNGPLMKVGLFHLVDGDRLLIVIHHLVIDGISWRILHEDIETLFGQYKQGEKLILPSKTDSYKLWSEKLLEYADSEIFLKEKSYWSGLESSVVPAIKTDFEIEANDGKDTPAFSFSFGKEETHFLLTKVNAAFSTGINDILLTAFGLGLKKTFGQERVLIMLEGHGREDILENVKITRTVGWFTSIYPVVLDLSYSEDRGRQIKEIKEALRRIPGKGTGYGILRYLTGEEYKQEIGFKLKPQISFNYLGQFDAEVNRESFFEIANESVGNAQGLKNQREYELDVSGMVVDKRLSMTFSYNGKYFKPATISALATHFQFELKQIIAFCCSGKARELTPSDLTYNDLSVAALDYICMNYPVEDIYPLSPMQESLLFHSLYHPTSAIYMEQSSYRIYKEINLNVVKKSLDELLNRYDGLRTAFIHEGLDCPVQVVLKEREVDIYYEDIGGIAGREAKEEFIDSFKNKNRQRLFDLSKDVLIRLAVFRVDEAEYEFIWTSPHIIMDGWSRTILVSNYFEIYNSFLESGKYQLPPAQPFGAYLKWLQSLDKNRMRHYWNEYLEGYETPAVIPKTMDMSTPGDVYRDEEVEYLLGLETINRLKKFTVKNQITLNIIFQTIWAIILGRYNEKQDVVFGVVVSGRPSQVEGIESMVGLFTNTIPFRIRYEEQTKFIDLLRSVRDDAIKMEPYHSLTLAEIQAQSPLKQDLLNHIFVFENYPVAFLKKNEKIETHEEFNEFSSYHFNVVIIPGEQFKIKSGYNAEMYDKSFVEKLTGHFGSIIDQILDNCDVRVKDIQISSGILEVEANILREDAGDFQF